MDRARVFELVKRHGWNATSFQVLEPPFRYWLDDGADACVAYVETGGAWVAAGAPLADERELPAVALRFVAAAKARGRRACFFAAESSLARAQGFASLLVGEQPVWDPTAWDVALASKKSLREQIRRATAKGVRVRPASSDEMADPRSPVRQRVEKLAAAWLEAKPMAPMGFLVHLELFDDASERRYLLAELGDAVVGVLVAVPIYARNGWLFEDVLRAPSAPNGTTELLIDAGMRAVAEEQSRYVTLGLAPLMGQVGPALRAARTLGAVLYDFGGVYAFKAKLSPASWEPIFLVHPAGSSGSVALYDALAAFARGSFARFGLETILRRPALIVRVLAILLLPWTLMLALASDGWFPAHWVKLAWIAFDLVLASGMLALARRWRPALAIALTTAMFSDAIVTTVEAIGFDAPRARGSLEWAVLAVACLAPALAAAVMAGAVSHRAGVAAR